MSVIRVTGVSMKDWHAHMVNRPQVLEAMTSVAGGEKTLAPVNAACVGNYEQQATAAATQSKSPVSIYEGLQTMINLARVNSGYDAADQSPNGKGTKEYFLRFMENVSSCPVLSLLTAESNAINQRSKSSDDLINSFVGMFVGLEEKDVDKVKSQVANLANAALSYSDTVEKCSAFAQALLQTDDRSGNLICHFYNSEFQIVHREGKGTIAFSDSYQLSTAVYQLSVEGWESVKDVFSDTLKTDTSSWLNNFTTPQKSGNGIRAICLERLR